MQTLIKNAAVIANDAWQWLQQPDADTALPDGPVLVPLAYWTQHRETLLRRGDAGVWLDVEDEPAELAEDVQQLPVIALHFPVFRDGRSYSHARILRDRYGYRGELRAIGDVLRDQLFYMQRCGFDAYALREDQDPALALRALEDFGHVYQRASDQRKPLIARGR